MRGGSIASFEICVHDVYDVTNGSSRSLNSSPYPNSPGRGCWSPRLHIQVRPALRVNDTRVASRDCIADIVDMSREMRCDSRARNLQLQPDLMVKESV